jgi:hypothetical protein
VALYGSSAGASYRYDLGPGDYSGSRNGGHTAGFASLVGDGCADADGRGGATGGILPGQPGVLSDRFVVGLEHHAP